MILDTHVKVTISNQGSYYRNLGYGPCNQKDIIFVKVEDLPEKTSRKVKCSCDFCSKIFYRQLQILNKKSKIYGDKQLCWDCSRKEVNKKADRTNTILSTKQRLGKNHPRWNPNKTDYNLYCAEVNRYTVLNNLSSLQNFEKRSSTCNKDSYHLDHIISKKFGFENDIPAKVIGNIHNLRFIPAKYNIIKNYKVSKESVKQVLENILDKNLDSAIEEILKSSENFKIIKNVNKKSCSEAGKTGGKICVENKLGIHGFSKEQRIICAKNANNCQKKNNQGRYNSKVQSELGKRGGPKNKGFRWYNDGVDNFKYTTMMQKDLSFEDFLKENPNYKEGRCLFNNCYLAWFNDGERAYRKSFININEFKKFLLENKNYKQGKIKKHFCKE